MRAASRSPFVSIFFALVLGASALGLEACRGGHASAPADQHLVVRGHVALAPKVTPALTSGTLFVTWTTADEQARMMMGQGVLETLKNLIIRGVVLGEVDVADGAHVPFALPVAAPGEVMLLAVVDVNHIGLEALLGGGKGTLLGQTAAIDVAARGADGVAVALIVAPHMTPPEGCSGERNTLLHLDAPEVAGTVGNATSRRICVHVPPGYAEHPARRYPVIFDLPGLMGDDQVAFAALHGDKIADEVGAELGHEAIIVAVDTKTVTGSTYLVDSPTSGNWDTFFAQNLIAYVDAHYRTLPRREARALLGHSTGGFNAVSYGLRHPELIGVIAGSSPDGLDFASWFTRADGKPPAWIVGFMRTEYGLGGAGQFISYAADWSPNPAAPRGYDWPIDPTTGALVPEVLARWNANSPSRWVVEPAAGAAARAAFSGRIYLTVGDKDEFDLYAPTVKFSEQLTAAGIEHALVVTRGGHITHVTEQIAAAYRFCLAHVPPAEDGP